MTSYNIGDLVGLLVAGESVTGEVMRIDGTTYVFAIVKVKVLSGRFTGETVAKPSFELFDASLACQGE